MNKKILLIPILALLSISVASTSSAKNLKAASRTVYIVNKTGQDLTLYSISKYNDDSKFSHPDILSVLKNGEQTKIHMSNGSIAPLGLGFVITYATSDYSTQCTFTYNDPAVGTTKIINKSNKSCNESLTDDNDDLILSPSS